MSRSLRPEAPVFCPAPQIDQAQCTLPLEIIDSALELFKQACVEEAERQQCEATISFLKLIMRVTAVGPADTTVLHQSLIAFVLEISKMGFRRVHHHRGTWDVSVAWEDPNHPSVMDSEGTGLA